MNGGFKGFSAKHAVSGLVLPNPDPEYIGSTMLFIQATAPTGWVKETGNNDCALRVTTGTPTTGGTNGFTTCFPGANRAVSATAPAISASAGAATLSSTQIPSHTHPYNTRSPIGVTYSSSLSVSPLQTRYTVLTSGQPGNIGSGGTGGSHSHTMPASPVSIVGTSLALSLKYLDAIFATRSNPSVAPTVTYDWYNPPSTDELGTPVTWRVLVDSATEGTTLYWSIEHISTSPEDFLATEGSFTINDTFIGSFTITTLADGLVEVSEQYKINVRTGSQIGPVVLTRTITIFESLQQAYTTAGSYFFTVPAGVTSICALVIGGGGCGAANISNGASASGAGGGGGLSWLNNIPVTPGEQLTIVVGAGGLTSANYRGQAGEASYIQRNSTNLVYAGGGGGGVGNDGNFRPVIEWIGGAGGSGGTSVDPSYGGGNGGNGGKGGNNSWRAGGGGAGGYTGAGGAGSNVAGSFVAGSNGSGGGGGGGGGSDSSGVAGGGGGVGMYGQGADGAGGTNGSPNGKGGSGGTTNPFLFKGGLYGGGGAGSTGGAYGVGSNGAVRIIWGSGRAFPSTITGDV